MQSRRLLEERNTLKKMEHSDTNLLNRRWGNFLTPQLSCDFQTVIPKPRQSGVGCESSRHPSGDKGTRDR